MAASEEEYARWVQYHADAFGLNEAGTALLIRWHEILACYPAEGLHKATDAMLRTQYPSWAGDHLKALLPLLREAEERRLNSRAKVRREDDQGSCARCSGSGWMCDLPHLKDLVGGEWRGRYTMGGFCSCSLGRWKAGNWQDRENLPRPLTFAAYETANPHWVSQRGLFYSRLKAEQDALRQAERRGIKEMALEASLDAVLARLWEKSTHGSEEE